MAAVAVGAAIRLLRLRLSQVAVEVVGRHGLSACMRQLIWGPRSRIALVPVALAERLGPGLVVALADRAGLPLSAEML